MSTTSQLDRPSPSPQKTARNDPNLRDGDSAHGNLYEPAADEVALDSDADLEDMTQSEEVVAVLTIVEPGIAGVIGLAPETDFSALTIPEVMERAKNLPSNELDRLIEFEQANRHRKTLVKKLQRLAEHSS
jgi:hypothetical protein